MTRSLTLLVIVGLFGAAAQARVVHTFDNDGDGDPLASNNAYYSHNAAGYYDLHVGTANDKITFVDRLALQGETHFTFDILGDNSHGDMFCTIQLDDTKYYISPDANYNFTQWTTIVTPLPAAAGATQVRLLSFQPGYSGGTDFSVDNVGMVPEPATLSLLALGGLALIRRRRA